MENLFSTGLEMFLAFLININLLGLLKMPLAFLININLLGLIIFFLAIFFLLVLTILIGLFFFSRPVSPGDPQPRDPGNG